MKWTVIALVGGMLGCSGSAKWSGFGGGGQTGTGSSEAQAPGSTTMPDLTLMTKAEAEQTLRSAGFTSSPELDEFACDSTLGDKRVVELGRVCYQMPAPGKPASTRLPVKLRVQQEDPWRGEYRAGRSWFLMPDFAGTEVEAAKGKIRALGFIAREVKVAYVVEPGCKPSTVCRTSPEAWTRADTTSDKIFFVGQPPESERPATTSAKQTTAPTSTTEKPKEPPPASTKPADIF